MFTRSQRLSLEAVMDRKEQTRLSVRGQLACLAMVGVQLEASPSFSRGFDVSITGEAIINTGSKLGEFFVTDKTSEMQLTTTDLHQRLQLGS